MIKVPAKSSSKYTINAMNYTMKSQVKEEWLSPPCGTVSSQKYSLLFLQQSFLQHSLGTPVQRYRKKIFKANLSFRKQESSILLLSVHLSMGEKKKLSWFNWNLFIENSIKGRSLWLQNEALEH